MVVTLGQQYNIGEKPNVILYTYTNRHAGTPEEQPRQDSTSSNMAAIIYCYIGCEAEVTTLKREQRGPWCIYLQHNPESTRHRYSPESRRRAVGGHILGEFLRQQSALHCVENNTCTKRRLFVSVQVLHVSQFRISVFSSPVRNERLLNQVSQTITSKKTLTLLWSVCR